MEHKDHLAACTSEGVSGADVPKRVQLSRAKGWRMPANTVSVARPTLWGNPFYVSKWRDVETCVALFRNAVRGVWNPSTSAHCPTAWNGYEEHHRWLFKMGNHPMDMAGQLRGKNLACWCRLGTPCHADVLLEVANESESGKRSKEPLCATCEGSKHLAAHRPLLSGPNAGEPLDHVYAAAQ